MLPVRVDLLCRFAWSSHGTQRRTRADPPDLLPAREAEDVGFSLLSLDESFSARESELELREEFPEEMFSGDDEVAHVVWHPRWVPVASNGEGDYYCIDLAPAKGGTVGQVIAVLQENYERYVISTSISTLIADLAEGLESGKYDYDEDLGIAQFGSDEEE